MVQYSHLWHSRLSKSFSQSLMIHTVKGFSILDETDVFLEFPCFLYNPVNVGNLISSSSSFSKSSLDICKFLVHIMLKPSMQDFNHDLTSTGDKCNCPMVSTFFGTTLLGDLGWGLTFSSPVATAGSSRFADIMNAKPWWHHPLGIRIVLLEFHCIHQLYWQQCFLRPLDFALQNIWLWVTNDTIVVFRFVKIFFIQFFHAPPVTDGKLETERSHWTFRYSTSLHR